MADTPLLQRSQPRITTPLLGRWILFGTSLLQGVSPFFLHLDDGADDPSFIPPGPFFAIWGVVIVGSIAVAISGLSSQHEDSSLPSQRVQLTLSLVHLGFVAWLIAATSPPPWLWLTLPIFLAMLAGLALCLREVQTSRETSTVSPLAAGAGGFNHFLLCALLGVYAGWSTPAVWLNAATLMPADSFQGGSGVTLQCLFVGGAAASAAGGTHLLRSQAAYSYLIAAAWALVGVTISAIRHGILPVALTAGTGLLGVVVVALSK